MHERELEVEGPVRTDTTFPRADLTNFCAAAGNVVSLSSTSTPVVVGLTSSTTSAAVAATGTTTQRTYSVSIPPITSVSLTFSTVTSTSSDSVPLGTAASSSSGERIVTLQLTDAGQPFPTQSKSANAFANSAQRAGFEVGKVVGALAVVAGGMMLV